MLNLISPNCKIIQIDGLTDGAARTVLIAKEFIDNEEELLIANSDQIIDFNDTGKREFHPIGKLNKLTFRFETFDNKIYENYNILN